MDLLDTPAKWLQTGAAARRFVEEERTWKAVVATYRQVYDRARLRHDGAARREPRDVNRVAL
jgi:hypothetical protein